MDSTELNKLKVADLKKILTDRGLDSKGKKEELIERILANPENSKQVDDELPQDDTGDDGVEPHTNENGTTNNNATATAAAAGGGAAGGDGNAAGGDGLETDEQRRAARMKRFGISETAAKVSGANTNAAENDRIKARQQRFGVAGANNNNNSNQQQQQQKTTGKRDAPATATAACSEAEKEKRIKRLERFQAAATDDQKKLLRAQRFA